MSDSSAGNQATATENVTAGADINSVVSRVLSLSIFFAGIGVFATIGFGLHRVALLAEYEVTYFTVGVVVGIVGLLLWILTR